MANRGDTVLHVTEETQEQGGEIALVRHVHNGNELDLTVMADDGTTYAAQAVRFYGDTDPEPPSLYPYWVPLS